jgi:methyltransferase (TIGR00027 family)
MTLTGVGGTALWIAAARARETMRPDRLFDDPWAADLAGPAGMEMLLARERPTGKENAFLPVRTRFFDDLIVSATDWADQVVLLGAGMDTRAYRLPLSAGTTVYELDHADVLDAKAQVLDRADATPRRTRVVVPVDLRTDWSEPLRDSGFRPDQPTVWVAEGVLFYLRPDEVDGLLGRAAALSAGRAELSVDVFGTGLLALPAMRPLVEHRERSGEPLPYCTDAPENLLSRNGWQPERIVRAGQESANFGRLGAAGPNRATSPDPTMRTHLIVGARKP